MQCRLGLFDRLQADLDHRLSSPSTAAAVERWRADEIVPRGCRLVLDVARLDEADPRRRRAVLAAMVHLAGRDVLAGDVAYAMVLEDLRRVAGQLTRVWRADREEMDQAVAIAGWDRIRRVAGRRLEWPDRVIVTGARDVVRDDLRRHARTSGHELLTAEVDPGPSEDSGFEDAAGLIQDALRRGVVSAESARLVWATRVMGVTAADLAAAGGERPNRVVMRRLRAERALRADRATTAGFGQAG